MKAFEVVGHYRRRPRGEFDDLLGTVLKLRLCLSARSAVRVCSTITAGEDAPSLLRHRLEAGFESSLVLHMVHFQLTKN